MTYKKNFVSAIKVGGKILRESKDSVELPLDPEYSILLKNLDSVRMQARISIDGKDATGWLVIGANQDVEVERFVEDLSRGNRFKFIERTEAIENHRGIKLEDGIVRIEFRREVVYNYFQSPVYHHYHYNYPSPYYTWSGGSGGPLRSSSFLGTVTTTSSGSIQGAQNTSSGAHVQAMNCAVVPEANDAGITVQGSISNQQFIKVPDFQTETAEVVIFRLVGKKAQGKVEVPKTVQQKLVCDTCGTRNKSSFKFCKQCGTSLERV